ncbi:hypothetical protein HK405_007515 [Cladochytrium tenue]|nr:hypothetical protein HK405_007515 [Cladochytrium tenue]
MQLLADWCTGLVDLRLYVTAMSWPTLQHVLMVAGGGGASAARVSGEGGRGLRSLSLRGSIDLRVSGGGVGPPSGGSFSMTKEARARLRALECLDLDLADDWLYRSPGVQGGDHDRLTRRVAAVATTAVTGGDETVWDESATVVPDGSTLRARTVAASQWILEQVGHAHMVRLRVRVPVRVPAGTVDRILAACVDGGGEVSRMRELWLDRVRLNERHVGVGGVLAGRSVAGGVDDDETTNSGFMQAGPAGFTRDGGGVPSMPFLSVLCLANTDVGDAGLAAIAAGRAGRLRALNVSATMVTDVGVRLVAASFAAVATVAATGDTGLRELYMDELPVSVGAVDQLLAAVGRGLEVLSLHGVQATPGRTMASVVRWCGGGVGTAGPVQSRLRRLDVFSATLWGQQVHGPDVAPGRVVRLLRACRQLEDLVIDFELFKRWIEQAKEADEAEVAAAAATTTRGAGGATGREDRASGPRAGALEGAFEMPLYMMRNFRAWWLAETPNDEEADEDDEGGNGGGGGGGGGSDPWWWADAFLSGPAGFAGDSNSGSHGNASTSDAHGGRLRHRRQRWRTAAASALAAELTRRFPRLDLDTNVSKVRLLYGGHLAAEGLLWGRERGWV